MQVGTKVVCVDDVFASEVARHFDELPVKGRHYTIRAVCLGRGVMAVVKDGKLVPNGGTEASVTVRVLLEELKNGPDPFKATEELGFNAERFRELEEAQETETRVEMVDVPETVTIH